MKQKVRQQQKQISKREVLQAGEHYGGIIDDQMVIDRQYFENHPTQKSYIRDYVPGEFWPEQAPICSRVEVTYLAPGVRHRKLVNDFQF